MVVLEQVLIDSRQSHKGTPTPNLIPSTNLIKLINR